MAETTSAFRRAVQRPETDFGKSLAVTGRRTTGRDPGNPNFVSCAKVTSENNANISRYDAELP